MESGELEIRQAFEETSTRNIKAMLEHGNETRRSLRVAEDKLIRLESTIRNQNEIIAELKKALTDFQILLYQKGITG